MFLSFCLIQDNLIGTLLAILGNVLVSISLSIQVQFSSARSFTSFSWMDSTSKLIVTTLLFFCSYFKQFNRILLFFKFSMFLSTLKVILGAGVCLHNIGIILLLFILRMYLVSQNVWLKPTRHNSVFPLVPSLLFAYISSLLNYPPVFVWCYPAKSSPVFQSACCSYVTLTLFVAEIQSREAGGRQGSPSLLPHKDLVVWFRADLDWGGGKLCLVCLCPPFACSASQRCLCR